MSNKTYEDYFKVKMCHFIDYSDLIRIIREVFGFPEYDVLEEIEDNHQSYYEIEVYMI